MAGDWAGAAGAGGGLMLGSRSAGEMEFITGALTGAGATVGGGGVGAKVIPLRGGSEMGAGAGGATWRGAGVDEVEAGADSGLAGPME